MSPPLQPEPFKILVTDLIDAGFIKAPTAVFGIHAGKRIQAIITADGAFVHCGNVYLSPSVAAGRAITAEHGTSSSGRSYAQINGWKFWNVSGPDGITRTLADLRDRLLS